MATKTKQRFRATRRRAKVGDKIKFTVATRQGMETGTRFVKVRLAGGYEVGFRGYDNFVVHFKEVSEVIKKPK